MFDRSNESDVAHQMVRDLGMAPNLNHDVDEPLVEEFAAIDDEFDELKRKHEQSVRERAYEIWENEGHPHGWELAHWLTAEQQIPPPENPPKT